MNAAHEMKSCFLNGILDFVRDFYPDPNSFEVDWREIQIYDTDEFLS